MKKIILLVVISVGLGVITGNVLANRSYFSVKDAENKGSVKFAYGQEFGINDPKLARDSAIGLLEKSDDEEKGTHKLNRGSDALTVYLTSSSLDLDKFVGFGVEIWGETNKRENTGWFIDVVKLKVLK